MPPRFRKKPAKNWFVDNWFPLEIWEQIIDYHFNDVEALQSCALTCSAFLSAAQLHLFGHVCLVRDRKPRSEGVQRHHHHYQPQYYPRFGRLYTCAELHELFTECPHLVSYIKSISFDDHLLESADSFTLGLIFSELNHIEEAAVFFPPYTSPIIDTDDDDEGLQGPHRHQPYSRKYFLEVFSQSTITSLDLCASLFLNSYELNSLLHQCENLEHFAWHQSGFFDWGRTPRRPDLTPPKLKSLHIHGRNTAAFEPFIQRRAPFNLSRVEELVVGQMDAAHVAITALRDLFHIVGASLLTFKIDVHSAQWVELQTLDGVFPLDFTETPNLRELHFHDMSATHYYHARWVEAIPIPPSLRSLTIELPCSYSPSEDKLRTSMQLIAVGENIAAHAAQLEDVTVIAHREHGCGHHCEGYGKTKEKEKEQQGKEKEREEKVKEEKDDLLDQILIRLPDLGGKLKVMERTVRPPSVGRRWRDFDRYLIPHVAAS